MSKVALVTGGALGYKNAGPSIGGAISLRLAKDGYKVIVVDQLKTGQDTVESIKSNGDEGLFIKGDVANSEFIKDVINSARENFGGLHVLVNCVARYNKAMSTSVADLSEEEWKRTMEVNLGAYFKCAKYAVPLILKSGGGAIVNISSIETFTALPNFAVYSISKAAVDGLTRTLAVDFAPKIRTNSVCPGFVRIANSENNRKQQELSKWYEQIALKYPMKRVCEVEEIASVVSFLVSDDASYINGQSLVVDGGKSISDSHQF